MIDLTVDTVEARRFTNRSTKVTTRLIFDIQTILNNVSQQTPSLGPGREAREPAETRTCLWPHDSPPVASGSQVSQSNMIDLTVDTDAGSTDNESDDDSEVEIIG